MSNKKMIINAEKKRQNIMSKLLDASRLLRGSYALVHTKCGRDNCWCKGAKSGHPHSRITWSEEGQGVTRKVPSEDQAWIQEVTGNYKDFRRLRREMTELEKQIKTSLDGFENDLVKKTRKGKSYLEVKPENCRPKVGHVTKTKNRGKGNKR